MLQHAIVGCGRVATNHADAFAQIPEATLSYAVDIEREKAEVLSRRFGILRTTTDYQDVLDDPNVTSVSLAVPHDLHAPMTMAAVRAGKSVLVEKPFVIDPRDGERIIAESEKLNIVVMPVVQHRFDEVVRQLRGLMRGQSLGTLVLVRAHLECMRRKEYYESSPWRGTWEREGGSVLMNQAYHIVDLLLWLCGPIDVAAADMATRVHQGVIETEDTFCATIRFRTGALGSLTISGGAGSEWNSYIEITGTKGAVAFDIGYPNTVHRLQLHEPNDMKTWQVRFDKAQKARPQPPPGLSYYGISHRQQAHAFVDFVLGRSSKSEGADLRHALLTVRTIHDFYAAARAGRSQTK